MTEQDDRRERYADDPAGWFEVINPRNTTTRIAYVHENGELYLPEGPDALTAEEFTFAAARDKVHRLIRVDEAMAVADKEQQKLRDELSDALVELDDLRGVKVDYETETAENLRLREELDALRAKVASA